MDVLTRLEKPFPRFPGMVPRFVNMVPRLINMVDARGIFPHT